MVYECVPYALDILEGTNRISLEVAPIQSPSQSYGSMRLGYTAAGAYQNSVFMGAVGLAAAACVACLEAGHKVPPHVLTFMAAVPVTCPTRGRKQTLQACCS